MDVINIILYVLVIILAIFFYIKKIRYTYWKRRGVDYIQPEFFYGNARKLIKGELSLGEQFQEFYRTFKGRGQRHGGVYTFFRPIYVPVDLDIIKNIFQKDFSHFVNHGLYVNEKSDPLSGNLFNLEDAKWKSLRAKLTPAFSSGKMKMMFQTLVACSEELEKVFNDHSIIKDAVDIKEVLSCFTTDVVASCAFGIDNNSLKNPNSEFRQFSRKIFDADFTARLKRLTVMLVPRHILIKFGFKLTRRDIETFFMNIVRQTVDYRERNNVFRKDFLHILLQLKNIGKITDDERIIDTGNDADKGNRSYLTFDEVAAQCFVFFLAGFETSASTATFALYELAVNQDIQEKLREEIRSVLEKHDDQITYESIMQMTYLDKVINETLRLHPPFPGTPRVCNKDYAVPGTNVVIEAGTRLHIPIYGVHTDPEYYPDPEVFDPERFNEENKSKRPACSFIPFGDGPRICIGARFGMMQSKVGLVAIIRRYRVTLNEKTVTPIRYSSRSFVMEVKGGVWLNVSKLN